MDSLAFNSSDLKSLIPAHMRQKIVYGLSSVESVFEGVEPMPVIGGDLAALPPKDASVVWIVDKISNVLQRICIQLRNTPDLKRLLVLATDVEEIAALLKSEPYQFLFEHPAFRIAVIDPQAAPDASVYRGVFQPTDWDLAHNTQFHYSFRPEFKGGDEWIAQIRGIFYMILMFFREGLGSSAYTEDAFLGFRNIMRNLPHLLSRPDLRNWKGLGHQKPAFLVGAGPSVKNQMEFLRAIQDDVIIIAADTMLKPLTKHGIRPHLIASIERAPEIVDLLDDPSDHPHSILVSSAVVEPECFKKYRGPSTAYFNLIPPSKWFPFSRSRFETGHSCMGLAMALSSFLECDPIYLMGIDLCWSEEGQSHMQDVPYLQKDFYLKQNAEFYKDSFAAENSQGRTVRTNLYWVAFKEQFEYWASVAPSKIYNLSPSGLALKGIKNISISDVQLNKKVKNFDRDLAKKWAYRRTPTIKNEIEQFIYSADKVVEGLKLLETQMADLKPKELYDKLEQVPFYHAILHPILKADVFNLIQENKKRAEDSRLSILKYLSQMKVVLEEVKVPLQQKLIEQKQGAELY